MYAFGDIVLIRIDTIIDYLNPIEAHHAYLREIHY